MKRQSVLNQLLRELDDDIKALSGSTDNARVYNDNPAWELKGYFRGRVAGLLTAINILRRFR